MKILLHAITIPFLLFGLTWAQDLDDADDFEMLDAEMNIDELSGKEREKAVQRLCEAEKPDLEVLYEALLSGKDGAGMKQKMHEVLARHASPQTFDKAKALAESNDPSVKKCGVSLVGKSRHPKATATLVRYLEPRFMSNKGDIVDALGDTGDKKAIPPVRRILRTDEALHTRAVFALMRLGDREVLPTFFELYGQTSAKLNHLYVYLPWAQKSKTRRQIERVRQDLEDHEQYVRTMQELLFQVPRSFIPDITAYLREASDPHTITLIFDNLQRMVTEENATDFLPLLGHQSSVLAQAALERIWQLGDEAARTKITKTLVEFAGSEDNYLRHMAVQNWRLLPEGQRMAVLCAGLKDASRLVRIECVEQLRLAGDTEALAGLKAALAATQDEVMRFDCQTAIHELENPVVKSGN